MSIPDLTIVVEPSREDWGSAEEQAEATDHWLAIARRLAQQLRASGATMTVEAAFLRDIVVPGLVLLDPSTPFAETLAECAPDAQATLPERTILLNADRSNVLATVERFGLAGAIEKHRFFVWATQDEPDAGIGLYGLRSVATTLAAPEILDGYSSERYCLFGSPRYAGLPELLLAYLERYCERLSAVPA